VFQVCLPLLHNPLLFSPLQNPPLRDTIDQSTNKSDTRNE
jgi:hypothetical protein